MAEGGIASQVLDAVEAKVNGIDERLEELDAQLTAAQEAEDKATQEFTETVSRDIKEKLEAFSKGLKGNTDDKLLNVEHRYGEHQTQTTRVRQTDVLRLNKITRDVSRGLGTDWKDVFTFIMAGCEKEVIEAEIKKIEKDRPVMQAYKAIMRWRDIKSEEGVDVDKLCEALQVWGKQELADHVKAILYSEGDELLKIGPVGKAVPTGGAAAASSADGNDSGAAAARPASATKSSADAEATGHIPDRKLLQLAKKIGPSWLELATLLGLADEDIAELKESEGMTYQGAFKMMWLWRDKTLDEDIDQRQVLKGALTANSMTDVAELV